MVPLQAGSPGTFAQTVAQLVCRIRTQVLPVIVPNIHDPELIKVRVKEETTTGVKRKRSISVSETADTRRMQCQLRADQQCSITTLV